MITEIITQPINSITVIALENVTLNCSASIDDVRYSWHRADGHIPSHSQGRHNDTFTIHRVTPHNQGIYYCVARRHGIIVRSSDASVQVDGKNIILHKITLNNSDVAQLTNVMEVVCTATHSKNSCKPLYKHHRDVNNLC